MAQPAGDDPDDTFPATLAAPARRALAAAGYTSLAQLAQVRQAELGKLHGMGPKALAARGRLFAADQA